MDLSNVLVSDIITEMNSNSEFALLTSDEKIQKIRTAIQRVMQDFKAVGSPKLVKNTLSAASLPLATNDIRSGTFVANAAGTVVPFSSAITGDYVLTAWDSGGQPIQTSLYNATDFLAIPALDGTTGFYIAIPEA